MEARTTQGQGHLSLQRSPGGTSQMHTLAGAHLSALGLKSQCSRCVESVNLWPSRVVPDLDCRGGPAQDSRVHFQTQLGTWAGLRGAEPQTRKGYENLLRLGLSPKITPGKTGRAERLFKPWRALGANRSGDTRTNQRSQEREGGFRDRKFY